MGFIFFLSIANREKRSRYRSRNNDLEEEIDHLRDDLRALKSKVRDADGGVHIHMHDGGEAENNQGSHPGDQNIHLYMHLGGEQDSNGK